MENPVWKNGRKAIHTFLEDSLEKQLKTQQIEYSHLMHDILEDPKNLFTHLSRTTASVMITLLYGSRITKYEGSRAQTFSRGFKLFIQALDPGAHPPIDLLWPLQYVPKRWAHWKRLGDTTRGIRDELYGSLYEQCERAIKDNQQTGCYLEELILNKDKLGMKREDIIGLGAVMMEGGVETIASFLQSFVLALINNPQVQEKGQNEIDSVVGPDRWPTLDDYERVPYIRAIADEVHRFRTSAPIGIPHVSTKEIQYGRYRIPKDSTIIMNIYGIFHDPDMYDDPERFDPERYVKNPPFGTKKREGVDTTGYRDNLAFGAGRRICPRVSLARRTIAQSIMNLLWAFHFKKDTSGTGGQDLDSYSKVESFFLHYLGFSLFIIHKADLDFFTFQSGIELRPNPFTCNVTPRSEAKAQMIKDRFAKAFPAGMDCGATMN